MADTMSQMKRLQAGTPADPHSADYGATGLDAFLPSSPSFDGTGAHAWTPSLPARSGCTLLFHHILLARSELARINGEL